MGSISEDTMPASLTNPTLIWTISTNNWRPGAVCHSGRVGEGSEAGDVIAFLASDRASYLTGVAINIDGGASAVG